MPSVDFISFLGSPVMSYTLGYTPGSYLLCPQNEQNPSKDQEGVCGKTDAHTQRGDMGINDVNSSSTVL